MVLACWLELELACLPAVREMEQLAVEEALAACKPERGATLPVVASSPAACLLSIWIQLQLLLGSKLQPLLGRWDPKLEPVWEEEQLV